MVMVTSGLNWKGEPCEFYINQLLKDNLDNIKKIVSSKDFDYVSIVAGLPGLGKSNFAINCAKYCDPNFTISNICSSAEEFIQLTETLPKKSAIVLDESFASLNAKVGMSREFLKIINHLQIIRQRNYYVFLCLPNFFDLSKGVSIYRAHHLFVCYGDYGFRGNFAAYDRDKKKMLFIKGLKFMDYHCVKPNFRGRFVKQKAIDEKAYDELKFNHLKKREEKDYYKTTPAHIERDKLMIHCKEKLRMPYKKLMEVTGLSKAQVYYIFKKERKKERNAVVS